MIGEKLGSFRIDAILGTGAMGVVYRATSETTGKTAAVKVINGEIGQRSKTYERFRREAEILQQFRHPNIVRFLAVGRYQGTSYFAMEFVPGQTLEQMLAERGPLPWYEVVDLGVQICEALHYAHEHSVVHRDLKPSNLMVTDKGVIKLTDFGIAKDLDATALTATGRTMGTAAYMSPEQIRGTPEVSHKTDLYSLGVVLYQMLTGKPAFEGTTAVVLMHCHLNEPAPRPSAKIVEIPTALDKLIVQLMAKDPPDRPWDAAAVTVALTEIRAKASRGETIPMVWATNDHQVGLDSLPSVEVARRTRKSSKAKAESEGFTLNRSMVELGLLVTGLIGLTGFLGYMLWPPSKEYLFRNAERLMASPDYHDWVSGRDEYLDPLNRRFPDEYKKESKEWRDRITLDTVIRRAKVLESPVTSAFNEPKTNGEHQYVTFHKLATEASKKGDDLTAIKYWKEMARTLEEDKTDPKNQPWAMLAQKRATDLQKDVDDRRNRVLGMLKRAVADAEAGRIEDAMQVRTTVWEENHQYADLADVFKAADLHGPEPATEKPAGEKAPSEKPAAGKAASEKPPAEKAPAEKPSSTETPKASSPDNAAPPSTPETPNRATEAASPRTP
jgi:serine/threonine-protein kinase